jgi:acetyl esterase/lipase
MTALRWASGRLQQLGGAGRPLAVAGDSAGGNLAAVAALCARDAGLPLAAQLLIYAATNMTGRLDADIARWYFGQRRDATGARDRRVTGAGGQPSRSGASHHRRGSA